jgi:Fur family transcriptional regulator, ferric uptake regulator
MSCHKPMLADLREHGVRLTAQRALILEDLYHHPGHCTADEIFGRVSQNLPGLNRATVYRTLELLRDSGVVTASNGPEGINQFELVQDNAQQHHHLHCRGCGAELPLETEPIDTLKAEIARRSGFQAELDHLYINGLCAACAAHATENRR